MKLLSSGNSKLKKDGIKSFGIQAKKTCPFAGACKSFCYASKGRYIFGSVANAHKNRLAATKKENFAEKISEELRHGDIIRIHDSGDFYSKSYLNRWIEIARAHPDNYFYAYTKSIDYFKGVSLPSNFRPIFSFGGKMDNKIDVENDFHARIFNTREEMFAAGYADSSDSDLVAAIGKSKKIGILFH